MQRERGTWSPSQSTLSNAQAVLDATAASGDLYRNGLGMIASENIVSPMVQKIVSSDLHGRYAEGLPGKRYYQGCDDFDTIEVLELSWLKRYSMLHLRIFNQLQEPFRT